MATALVLAENTIRVARIQNGRIDHLEAFSIPIDNDPIATIAQIPLTGTLGPVRVFLEDPDMLLKPMVQPPTNPERIGRIITFELRSMNQDNDNGLCYSWHIPAVGGSSGDMPVTAMITKEVLIKRVSEAVTALGGRLTHLCPASLGLYRCFKQTYGEEAGDAVVLDINDNECHLCLVQDGELIFMRHQSSGRQQLIQDIADLRGLSIDDARDLLGKLGDNTPDDITDVIDRFARILSSFIKSQIRLAQAQLHLGPSWNPNHLYLSGPGASWTINTAREGMSWEL